MENAIFDRRFADCIIIHFFGGSAQVFIVFNLSSSCHFHYDALVNAVIMPTNHGTAYERVYVFKYQEGHR